MSSRLSQHAKTPRGNYILACFESLEDKIFLAQLYAKGVGVADFGFYYADSQQTGNENDSKKFST